MAVMAETAIAKDEVGQQAVNQDSTSEEASEEATEAGEELQEDCDEEADSPSQIRDTEEAAFEAFADLSMDQLQEMARRLTKCTEGFQEMLREAEDEQEQLMREGAELNEHISHAMQDIQREEQRPKPMEVAAQVGQKAVLRLQMLHQRFVTRANDQLNGLVDKGADFVQIAKKRHAEAVAARAERQAAAQKKHRSRSAAQKKRQKPKAKKEKTHATDDGIAEPAKPAAAALEKVPSSKGPAKLQDVVLKKTGAEDPIKEKVVSQVNVNAIVPDGGLKKTKPTLSTDATVVIEAKVVVDGIAHLLEVRMTDSCEDAARRFIEEHRQRKWFEEPLVAFLKLAEADAVKLPLRVEADLSELKKEHAKNAKKAQMPTSA